MSKFFKSDREKGVIIFEFMGSSIHVSPQQEIPIPDSIYDSRKGQLLINKVLQVEGQKGLKVVSGSEPDKIEEVPEVIISNIPDDEVIEDTVEQTMDMEEMTKKELKVKAVKMGLDLDPKKMRKAEMITAILNFEG